MTGQMGSEALAGAAGQGEMFPNAISPRVDPRNLLDEACERFPEATLLSGFSGGTDSLVTLDIVREHPRCAGALYLDTTCAIPAVGAYVEQTTGALAVPLHTARPPVTYHDIVLQHGFPGPGQHGTAYIRLKARAIRAVRRQLGGGLLILATGVRRTESRRRMGHVKPIQFDRKEGIVWVAPIIDYTHGDKAAHVDAAGLRISDTAALLHRSGECNCGSFASADEEREELRAFYPDFEAELSDLEVMAAKRDVWCRWGKPMPKRFQKAWRLNQTEMCIPMMCTGCDTRHTAAAGRP
jgi:3'-phosphoadenosine 5'-phosphosulfate sulfotransferase (PAPS reductase)/FAD synthetase